MVLEISDINYSQSTHVMYKIRENDIPLSPTIQPLTWHPFIFASISRSLTLVPSVSVYCKAGALHWWTSVSVYCKAGALHWWTSVSVYCRATVRPEPVHTGDRRVYCKAALHCMCLSTVRPEPYTGGALHWWTSVSVYCRAGALHWWSVYLSTVRSEPYTGAPVYLSTVRPEPYTGDRRICLLYCKAPVWSLTLVL